MADGKNERERQEKKREVSERERMGMVELVKGMERWREERERLWEGKRPVWCSRVDWLV